MFPTIEKRKNCFLAACKIWDLNIDLDEIGQKFPPGGRIGYENSLLDFFLARLEIFRPHAILQDSAGAVKTKTDEGPGYSYMQRHKKTLHCAEKKAYAYGTWVLNFFDKI